MKRLIVPFLFLLSFSMSGSLSAELPKIVSQAFAAMENIDKQEWAYTRTSTEGKEARVEQFDPRNTPQWTVISVNAETPGAKKRKRYKKEQKEAAESTKNISRNKFENLAEPNSWKLISENESEVTYLFKPLPENEQDKKIMQNLTGTIRIDKFEPYLKSFQIKADRPFKPMAMVKILSMELEIMLADIGNGEYFPVKNINNVMIRA